MYQSAAMQQYQNIGVETCVIDAGPHRVVSLLLQGAIDKLAHAKCHALRKDTASKARSVSGVLAIVATLRGALDVELGGGLGENLYALYDYIEARLLETNFNADNAIFDESMSLLGEVLEGWNNIPVHSR